MAWNVPAQVIPSASMPALSPSASVQMEDAARIGAVDDEMGDAMGERVGLARAGAGDDQQRPSFHPQPHAMLGRAALLGIEFGQVRQACRHVKTSKKVRMPSIQVSRFVRKGFGAGIHLA